MNNQLNSFSNIVDSNKELKQLPIYDILEPIRMSLETKSNLLLQASPGAGKTTVVPIYLTSLTDQNIIVIQPRRVATRSAAQRMASILNEPVGQSVGYIIRGEVKVSSKTKVTVMTDGVLLNKLRDDPELNGVDVIILDEFHERGVGSDTALALCREVQMNFRPDLKIVVMSATLLGDDNKNMNDTGNYETTGAKLVRVLGSCDVLRSEGRQYEIKFQHSKRGSPPHGMLLNDSKKLVETTTDVIIEGLQSAPSKGDVLAFLPGAKEIRRVVQELRNRNLSDVDIFPLYGALPKKEQDLAIYKTSNRRRIIVSSPIAEASLTIQGVTCVVDSGLCREPRFDIETGLPRLLTVACSKDSAIQRAGRAGRTQEGLCIRLFSETEFDRFQLHATPEISSTDLVPTVLLLSDWGCSSTNAILDDIPFVDVPPRDGIENAFKMLVDLDALESNSFKSKIESDQERRYNVTPHGRKLVKCPTHPRFASAIVKAGGASLERHVAAIVSVAILEDETGRIKNQDANIAQVVKNIFKQGENSMVGEQIIQYASRTAPEALDGIRRAFYDVEFSREVVKAVGMSLLSGFIDLVAQRKGDASYSSSTYMLSLGRSARLDGIQDAGDYIVVLTTSSGDDGISRIRSYAPINIENLKDIAIEKDEIYTVESRGFEVRARRVLKVGSLELSSTPIEAPSSEEITETLVQTIVAQGGVNKAILQNQSKQSKIAIDELRNRIRIASKLSQAQTWPECFVALESMDESQATEVEEEILLDIVEPWLSAAGSLKNLNMCDILLSTLTPDQRRYLDAYFPIKIEAPDGSIISLSYAGDIPTASAKLQQFFGSTLSPTVGEPNSSLPISLTLLSPSGKTLAQTIDLPFFWKEVYPSVRTEMRGRYPKHPWPEDPMTAEPTRLSKKQLESQSGQEGGKEDKRKAKSAERKRKK